LSLCACFFGRELVFRSLPLAPAANSFLSFSDFQHPVQHTTTSSICFVLYIYICMNPGPKKIQKNEIKKKIILERKEKGVARSSLSIQITPNTHNPSSWKGREKACRSLTRSLARSRFRSNNSKTLFFTRAGTPSSPPAPPPPAPRPPRSRSTPKRASPQTAASRAPCCRSSSTRPRA
jgi:hypothetical protein